MSTIILLCLAIVIIFWRPPFRLPHVTKKTVTPVILFIMLSSLLLLGTFKPYSDGDCCSQAEAQANTNTNARHQTQFTR